MLFLELFDLIHSLSKSEKRAFKLHANYNKEASLTTLLFDYIGKLKTKDEKVLKRKIKEPKLLQKLSRVKYDLYHRILDFLANYHEEEEIGDQIYKQIRKANILAKKELYRQAWEQLLKAKQKAQLYEKYPQLLEVLILQKYIVNRTEQPQQKLLKHSDFNLEIKDTLGRLNWLFKFEQLYGTLLTEFRDNGVCHHPQQVLAYQTALDAMPPQEYDGYRFSKFYILIQSLYYNLLGNRELSYESKKRIIEINEQYPHFIALRPEEHLISFTNCIYAGIRGKAYKRAMIDTQKANTFLATTPLWLQEKYKCTFWDINLSCLNGVGKHQEAFELLIQIEAEIGRLETIHEGAFLTIFCNSLIETCFFVQNYDKALDWINYILDKRKTTLRQDYYINIRFLECFALIENDLSWLVSGKVRSLRTFLKAKGRLLELEEELLKLIKKLAAQAHRRKEQKRLYKNMLMWLEKQQGQRTIETFDYHKWIAQVLK